MCACTDLVLHGDLGGQRVVRVPLLVEAQAELLHLVFGLQAAGGFARVRVAGAGRVELLWRFTACFSLVENSHLICACCRLAFQTCIFVIK